VSRITARRPSKPHRRALASRSPGQCRRSSAARERCRGGPVDHRESTRADHHVEACCIRRRGERSSESAELTGTVRGRQWVHLPAEDDRRNHGEVEPALLVRPPIARLSGAPLTCASSRQLRLGGDAKSDGSAREPLPRSERPSEWRAVRCDCLSCSRRSQQKKEEAGPAPEGVEVDGKASKILGIGQAKPSPRGSKTNRPPPPRKQSSFKKKLVLCPPPPAFLSLASKRTHSDNGRGRVVGQSALSQSAGHLPQRKAHDRSIPVASPQPVTHGPEERRRAP
jgi:hypothetical protein